jgi:hypothetical protein
MLPFPNRNRHSNLRIEIKKSINAVAQLGFNLFPRAFQNMHCYPRLVPILQLHRSVAYLGDLIGWQQPHPVDQCQIRHAAHLIRQPHNWEQASV